MKAKLTGRKLVHAVENQPDCSRVCGGGVGWGAGVAKRMVKRREEEWRKRRGYFCCSCSQRSLKGQIYGIDTLDLFSTDGKAVKGPTTVRRAVLSQTGFMSENIYSHGVLLRWCEFTPCENIGAVFWC